MKLLFGSSRAQHPCSLKLGFFCPKNKQKSNEKIFLHKKAVLGSYIEVYA